MILDDVNEIIKLSFSKETCYPGLQDVYDESNKALGHCAVTALVINDFVGGKIMRCMVDNISHYYNLINGNVVDLTKDQFNGVIPDYSKGEERTREYLLSSPDTKSRYLLLLKNVKNNFKKYGTKDYKLQGVEGTYLSKVPGTIGGNKKLKIYGKIDCPSALYWLDKGYYKDNRVFFKDENTAKLCGYRPCAKCMKKEYNNWKNKR